MPMIDAPELQAALAALPQPEGVELSVRHQIERDLFVLMAGTDYEHRLTVGIPHEYVRAAGAERSMSDALAVVRRQLAEDGLPVVAAREPAPMVLLRTEDLPEHLTTTTQYFIS